MSRCPFWQTPFPSSGCSRGRRCSGSSCRSSRARCRCGAPCTFARSRRSYRPTSAAAVTGSLASLRRLRLPGRVTVQTPVRRIVRAPARSIADDPRDRLHHGATARRAGRDRLGVGHDRQRRTHPHRPDRATGSSSISPATRPATSALVRRIERSPLVGRAEPALEHGRLPRARRDDVRRLDQHGEPERATSPAPAAIAALHLKPGGIVISQEGRRRSAHPRRSDDVTLAASPARRHRVPLRRHPPPGARRHTRARIDSSPTWTCATRTSWGSTASSTPSKVQPRTRRHDGATATRRSPRCPESPRHCRRARCRGRCATSSPSSATCSSSCRS